MKYPECCYQQKGGVYVNTFTPLFDKLHKECPKCGGRVSELTNHITKCDGYCELNYTIKEYNKMEWKQEKDYKTDILTGITAETLAELAIKNNEWIIVLLGAYWNDDRVKIGAANHSDILQNTDRGKDELLGEFFLRVAKERKYIK